MLLINKTNNHTATLENFMREINYYSIDLASPQKIWYTLNNHTGKRWIDHMLVEIGSLNFQKATILDDDFN